MPIVQTDAGAFHVAIDGPEDAPPLLFSNSLTCDLTMWDAQVAALAGPFRVIRHDGRGQGRSVTPRGPYTLEQLGRDAIAVLDALAVPQAHFCGLSMGGMVGQWLLTHAPERLHRVILANTAAHMGPPALWDGRIALVRQGGMDAAAEPTVTRWFPPSFHASAAATVERMRAVIRATPVEGYIACCEAIRDMDQRETIKAATTATLIIVGANDQATTPADGALIHAAIAGSQLVTLPAGHISAVEVPAAFNAAVAGFLGQR